MTPFVRLLLVAAAVSLVTAACAAFPQQETEFSDAVDGTYYVNGVDSRGIEYGGRLEITPGGTANRYEMQWIVTGSIQLGSGVREGNRIDAEWSTVEGLVNREGTDISRGTVRYTIATDGTLNGVRTTVGQTETGTEEAFPIR